jgi:MerR family transcriptional regulator/heat shock protein HspR
MPAPISRAVYVISVAAELAGVHPQTLRIYERKGLLDPARTAGGNRRYSEADLDRLRRIAELTDEGLNLAGVRRVLELEAELAALRSDLNRVRSEAAERLAETERRHRRDLVPVSQAVSLWGRKASIFDEELR